MSESGIFSGDPGYTTTIYLPTGNPPGATQYPLGSSICILVYLQNLHDQSTSLPSVETVKVTSLNNQSGSTGIIFYEFSCSVPGSYNGSFGPNSMGWGCVAAWDTSKPFNGILPTTASPDIYEAIVTISMADSNVIQVTDSFGFTS
jgi:hypothetical protein